MSAADTRALRKLVNTVEAAGGWFHKQDERPFLMDIFLPDAMVESHTGVIRDSYDGIFALLFPPRARSSRKRNVCKICASGHGCRRRQAVKQYQLCPVCTHWCASHFLPEVAYGGATTPGGCLKWVGPDLAKTRCTCTGWPQPPEPVKTHKKATQENSMPLFSTEELAESHERYLEKQAALEGEKPRSKAEILVDLVRNDPTLTVAELVEGSEMSATWVRKHLRNAGLKAAKAPRQRNSESGEGR
jgi:hypothetical protein